MTGKVKKSEKLAIRRKVNSIWRGLIMKTSHAKKQQKKQLAYLRFVLKIGVDLSGALQQLSSISGQYNAHSPDVLLLST